MTARRFLPMVVAILAGLGAARGQAASPGVACQATKLLAAGRKAQAVLRCHATAAGSATDVTDCVNRANAKLGDVFTTLEAAKPCVTTGDAATVGTDVDRLVFYVRLALRPPPSPSHCSAARLRAVARVAIQLFALNARDERHPTPGLNDRETVVRVRYYDAYLAAAARGDCLPTDDDPLRLVEDQMRVVIGRVFPFCPDNVRATTEECDTNDAPTCPLQCNRDCTCPHCGDGLVNVATEQCDGTADTACPGDCRADCTCPPPVCGDGRINQPAEQCDGAADTACPGACRADCTCPPPMCGDGRVNQPGEQCDVPDDGACAGLCQPDCTCPAPVCGNLVVESGEACEGGTCPTPIGLEGCFPPGDPLQCQCCALVGGGCVVPDILLYIPCCPGGVCMPPQAPHQPGFCVAACTTDADCTGGQMCIRGGCLGPFPPCAPDCPFFTNCEPVHDVCVPCTYLGPCGP
jgi:hypothetical protein